MIIIMILAWILTWFNLDDLSVQGLNQVFNTDYTTSVYWLIWFIIGLIILIKRK